VARQRGTIDEESALVLHQVIDGWAQARLYRDVQETVDDLLDKQLLEKRNGNLEPSPDVLFSLGLEKLYDPVHRCRAHTGAADQ
jgi:hypothetical protein